MGKYELVNKQAAHTWTWELYSYFWTALPSVLGKETYLQLLTGFFISQYKWQLSAQTSKVHVNQHVCSLWGDFIDGLSDLKLTTLLPKQMSQME